MMMFILSLLFLAQAVVCLASEQAIQGIVGGAMAFNLMYRHAYASTNGFDFLHPLQLDWDCLLGF